MIKATLLTALAVASFANIAQASTVDILLGTGSSDPYAYSTGSNSLSPNIDLSTTTSLSGSNYGTFAAGVSNTQAASPSGTLYGGNYLSVFGNGSATFSLASNGNSFGLTWGSIDPYNTLIVSDSRGVSYTITGTELLSYLSGSTSGSSQSDVQINDPFGRITSIELTGNQNSFEAANFSASTAVPLPASSMLFAMALAGLAFFGWQRQQKSRI